MRATISQERLILSDGLETLTEKVRQIRLDEKILSAQFRDTYLTSAELEAAYAARWEAEDESA